ncbi:FadR/GntR family transcriptional regulator, partial [Prescottella equi]
MTTALSRNLLADQAADQLRRRLQAGEWEVGTKLPGETTLAAELGVGRSTIREALRMLAGQGLLRPRQGAGVFVERVEPETDGWEAVLQREAVVAVVEARAAIEIEAARLAAV